MREAEYFPTARERLNNGQEPVSPRRFDANFLLEAGNIRRRRNKDVSLEGAQRVGNRQIKGKRVV